jgi:hypothetical protein
MDIFLFMIILPWKLFLGPPWLEKETRIRELPIPVHIGTTSGPQE